MKSNLRKMIALSVLGALAVALGVATAYAGDGHGGGHTPVTICHKPGTPAEQTLVVDDDSVELTGHLGHGDTLGPCSQETTPTETTPTDTTPTETTPTETTPTEPVPTTPAPPRCPPGEGPYDGKDGDESEPGHNDECCPDSNQNQVCDYKETTPTTVKTEAGVTAVSSSQATTTATATSDPAVTASTPATKVTKAKVAKKAKKKQAAPVKLTGNQKVDRCKKKSSLLVCQPGGPGTPTITVVAGNG